MNDPRPGLKDNNLDDSSDALAYALGWMHPNEETQFESQLKAGSPEAEELDEYLETLTALAEEVAEHMPLPKKDLRSRILASVERAQSSIIRAHEGEWTESGVPGITMKILYQNTVEKRFTVLARLAAGAHYPTHRHVGREECLVVEGDLHLDGITLTAGDFIATPDGEHHRETYSENGCLLLLSTALADEILN